MTIAIRPSKWRRDGAVSKVICGQNEAECFSRADWTRQITLILRENLCSGDIRCVSEATSSVLVLRSLRSSRLEGWAAGEVSACMARDAASRLLTVRDWHCPRG
ncbi:hypothetical protein CWO89_22890 [Bradyrhizobium sp. Leo170]|nr:hypothetical protein CWO89_22890 [Bradyrhizobium sp. Leo170]